MKRLSEVIKSEITRKQKNQRLKRQYGISLQDYDNLLKRQNGNCAICGIPHSDPWNILHVDHDHETGDIRGLLCGTCNSALGLFCESVETMRAAIKYLEDNYRKSHLY